jgi:hypothetical protein
MEVLQTLETVFTTLSPDDQVSVRKKMYGFEKVFIIFIYYNI